MIQNADYFLTNTHYCEARDGAQGEEGEGQQDAVRFCENLFGVSVDVVTCAAYGEEANGNEQQQEEECVCEEEQADEAPEEEDAEGDEGDNEGERKKRRRNQECECNQQANNGYQINYDEIGDVEASCSTIRNLLQIDPDTFNGMSAEYVVSSWSNVRDGHQPSSSSGRRGWIFALVVLAVVAVIAMIAFARGRGRKKAAAESSKTEPLVGSANKPARKKKESIEIYFQGTKRQASDS